MITGIYNVVLFILNIAFVRLLTAATAGLVSGLVSLVALLVTTRFSDQVKIRFISQLSLYYSSNLVSMF